MTERTYVDFGPVFRELNGLGRQIDGVGVAVDGVHAEVSAVKADLDSTRGDLLQLRQRFEDYVVEAERTANVQRSETVIGNIEAELERDFGHYKAVRRSSVGTLQAFDIGNVTNRTVQQVSEELMIQTPRYWLAPALVALATWSRDDKDLCNKSVEEAFNRDPAKTGLFFALVLRRQGRMESATRWLRHYLSSLDPRALGREFGVILEATAQDGFGSHGREMVSTQLVEWNATLRADPAVTTKQVNSWRDEMLVNRGTLDESNYPHLSKVTPQWGQLKELLEHASAHGNILAKFGAVRDAAVQLTADVADRLDDILETLVDEFDAEELPYQRDVIYHRAVIEHRGDLDRAKQEADIHTTALDETMDLVSLQTQIALRPELMGTTLSTQQLAVGVGRSDFREAIDKYCAGYRSSYIEHVDLLLDGQHSAFAINLGFPGWQASSATPQGEAEASLVNTWDMTLKQYLERVRFKEANYLIGGAIVLALTLIGFLMAPVAGLMLLVLSGAGVGGWLWTKKRAADAQYGEAKRMREQAIAFSIDVYRATTAELVDAKLAYQEEDQKAVLVIRLVDTWPTRVGLADSTDVPQGVA